MTGAEHYAEAERLINHAANWGDEAPRILAMAQVHATLALTAATANRILGNLPSGGNLERFSADANAWAEAIL